MKNKLLPIAIAIGAVALTATARGQTPATVSTGSTVQVVYEHPENYSDLQSNTYTQTQLLDSLRAYLQETAAPHIGQGNTLAIKITDIDRAGEIDPATASRRMKSVFPPSVKMTWTLTNAGGAIVRQGTETLVDKGFLTRSNLARDPMYYEKEMLGVWIHRTFR